MSTYHYINNNNNNMSQYLLFMFHIIDRCYRDFIKCDMIKSDKGSPRRQYYML